jgi:hypothetical protein
VATGADDDLDAYVAARRPVLEEVLRRLDCPRFLVTGLISETVGRCRPHWSRTARDDDVDVVVLGALLESWQGRHRAEGWQPRSGRVLVEVAGLDPQQAADVVETLRRARLRPLAVRVVAGLVAAVVVGGAVLALWPAPEPVDDHALPPAEVQQAEGLVDAIWYSGGLLRLRDATVVVGGVRDLAEVPGGAVYLGGDGHVVLVDGSGARTALGRAAVDSPVVAGADGSLAAWRDPEGDLVAVEVPGGGEVGRVSGLGLQPVAIDAGRVYYNDPAGSAAFTPGRSPGRISGLPLVDVRAGSRLLQAGAGQVRLSGPVSSGTASVASGTGLSLSPDGRFALVRSGARLQALDLLGGTVATGLRDDERALAATLGRDGTVILVVASPERAGAGDEYGRASASGTWELRTCTLGTGTCEVATALSAARDVPVFAR